MALGRLVGDPNPDVAVRGLSTLDAESQFHTLLSVRPHAVDPTAIVAAAVAGDDRWRHSVVIGGHMSEDRSPLDKSVVLGPVASVGL
jgi:hypothetical protein